jgi:hypothetical protein
MWEADETHRAGGHDGTGVLAWLVVCKPYRLGIRCSESPWRTIQGGGLIHPNPGTGETFCGALTKEYQTEGLTRAAVLITQDADDLADVIQIFPRYRSSRSCGTATGALGAAHDRAEPSRRRPSRLHPRCDTGQVARAAPGDTPRTVMPRSTASEPPPASTLRHPAPLPALASVTTAPVAPRRVPPAQPATTAAAPPAPPRRSSVAPQLVSVAAAPETLPTRRLSPLLLPRLLHQLLYPPRPPAVAAQRYGLIKPGNPVWHRAATAPAQR